MMVTETFVSLQEMEEAAAIVRQHADIEPRCGLILGSGLSGLADAVSDAVVLDFSMIPGFPVSTVKGHQGQLILGHLEGRPVVVMKGRGHYYEGYTMGTIGLPVRVMALLGVQALIVTNAAGGLNMNYAAGEVMIIKDHINLIGMAGLNPLRGPNLESFGPRFPSMNEAYDAELREIAGDIALEAKIPHHEGVYICLAGPSFETPADVRFLRLIGADAVGMSTVPEVITARHSGLRVLGLSGITNTLSGEASPYAPPPDHEEVLEAGKTLVPRLQQIIRGVLQEL
jgi:purine-nucleoside phosphorylase